MTQAAAIVMLRNSLAYEEDPTMQASIQNAEEQIKWGRQANDTGHVIFWENRLRLIKLVATAEQQELPF